jgi:hypothetical protein
MSPEPDTAAKYYRSMNAFATARCSTYQLMFSMIG